MFCIETSRCVSLNYVSRLASFGGGAKMMVIGASLLACTMWQTDLGSGSGCDASFDSFMDPSGYIQNVGVW